MNRDQYLLKQAQSQQDELPPKTEQNELGDSKRKLGVPGSGELSRLTGGTKPVVFRLLPGVSDPQ
ncbi:MAG: hypothetical protein U1C96_07580 [Gallionella sp.]|nr:hypothetical protein [Gallionella sp.]